MRFNEWVLIKSYRIFISRSLSDLSRDFVGLWQDLCFDLFSRSSSFSQKKYGEKKVFFYDLQKA